MSTVAAWLLVKAYNVKFARPIVKLCFRSVAGHYNKRQAQLNAAPWGVS